jgi:hypothetical protein
MTMDVVVSLQRMRRTLKPLCCLLTQSAGFGVECGECAIDCDHRVAGNR